MQLSNKFEIMVLTYNRKELLKKTIDSLLASTVKNIKITIVDNASSDGTEDVVKEYMNKYPNVHTIRQEKPNDNSWKNIQTAVKNATAEYMMVFHDDDIIHHQYIESALKIIDKEKNVDLICTNKNVFTDEKDIRQDIYKKINYKVFENKLDFTTLIYINKYGKDLCFPNVIYKTRNFQKIIDTYNSPMYGKIGDKPLVLETVNDGTCVFISNKMLNYRIHKGQDTKCKNNGPYDNEIKAFNKYFLDILKATKYTNFVYNVHVYYWIKGLNHWGYGDRDLKILAKQMFDEGLITKFTYNICASKFGLILKKINYLLKKSIRTKSKKKSIKIN